MTFNKNSLILINIYLKCSNMFLKYDYQVIHTPLEKKRKKKEKKDKEIGRELVVRGYI